MFKKISLKVWVIIILCVIVALTVMTICLVTATKKDKQRFIYELNEDGLSYSVVGIKNAYRGGWFAKETIEVPQTYKGYPVTSIKQIKNLQKTKTVILPEGLKEIGASAFYGCSITSINIPDTVETVGISAFENCTKLTDVTLPNGMNSISDAVFRSCFSLKEIKFPDTINYIGDGAFANCYNLQSINFPNGLTNIAANAFSTCTSLTDIELPASLQTIGDKAFEKCYSLIEICNHSLRVRLTAGSSANGQVAENALHVYSNAAESKLVKTADGSVFYNNDGEILFVKHLGTETELTLPANLNGQGYDIHSYAFYNNSTLEKVVIPDGVTEIGRHAFDNCSALKKVTIGNGVKIINSRAFLSCKKLTEVSFGNSIEEIGLEAFFECQRLEEIQLKDGVRIIGEGAFGECGQLKKVSIGKGLQEIGAEAFFNCVRFTELHFGGTTEEWEAVELGNQWTWDNNSNKRAPSCDTIICSNGTIKIEAPAE